MPHLYRSVAAMLCLLAMTFFVDSTSAAAFKRVHAGGEAPSFTLPDLDGNQVSLDDHKEGPLTIVTFWALWSPKSEPLLQDIQKILDEFGDKGLAVKAIAVNEDGEDAPADFAEQVKGLIERNGLQFPVVIDQGMEEYSNWGVIATPSTAFLGKDLKVEYEFSGHPTSAYLDMRVEVMKALGIEEEVTEAAKPKRERYQAEHRVLLNYGLSKTLFERGQFSKARRKLKKVLTEDPEFPDAHALSGLIHLGLAQGGKASAAQTAREAFDKAVELDATVPTGLIGQAHFALEDDDTAKALELSQTAAQFTEDEVLTHLESAENEMMGQAVAARAEETAAMEGSLKPPEAQTPETAKTDVGAPAVVDAASTEAKTGTEEEAASAGDEVVAAAATEPAGPKTGNDGIPPQLGKAKALLEAGDEAGAKALVSEFVTAYLAIPEGPSMSEKGLKMKMLIKQQADAK